MRVDWMIVLVCVPERPIENGGVLVVDHESKRLSSRFMPARPEWDEDVALVWNSLGEELSELSNDLGPDQLISWLESSASHTIRVSKMQSLEADSVGACLDKLYVEHVNSKSRAARTSA